MAHISLQRIEWRAENTKGKWSEMEIIESGTFP